MVTYSNDIPDAPKAVGPYSQAARSGNLLFLSGQVALDPANGQLVPGGITEQCEQVMKNLAAILTHHKLGFGDVVKTTILLADIGDFKTVNEVYGRCMNGAKPARATYQVAALPLAARIEIEMIAEIR